MTPSNASGHEEIKEAELPRRDWILLPLLSLLTIAFVVGSTELIARHLFPQTKKTIYALVHDSSVAMRGYPNVVCRGSNNHDIPATEYRLNSCGHRTSLGCGPKSMGVYRMVLVGSSVALGEGVPMEKTIAALLPKDISQQTGRKVELYNEGMWSEVPHVIAQNFNVVQAASPDMILWVLTPHDITVTPLALDAENSPQVAGMGGAATGHQAGFLLRLWRRVKESLSTKSVPDAIGELWQHALDDYGTPPSVILLQHVLYKSQSQYVKSYLRRGDDDTGFLQAHLSPQWQSYLQAFDADAARVEAQAKTAGVPLVVVLVPNRAQAAMISMGEWPAGYDPYKLDDELRSIIVSHGGIYADILPGFRTIPNPEQYYFPVDGHPNAEGHAIIANLLAKALTNASVPALSATSPTQPAPAKVN
jgi:hypothetical protein